MVRFLPNPFEKKTKKEHETGVLVHEIKVYDSELWCDRCSGMATEGTYQPEAKRLTFTCPNGHDNVVRNIDI